MKLITILRQVM